MLDLFGSPTPRILVACEQSGVVRSAFRQRGYAAWSCDILSAEDESPFHYQCDVRDVLQQPWSLVIAHPPCTYLSRVAVRWLDQSGRRELREEAMRFFMLMYDAPTPRVCVENPVGYPWQAFRRPNQSIEPYQFGHEDRKKTCLWLRGLPLLRATTPKACPPEHLYVGSDGKRRFRTAAMGGKDKTKKRSRTFEGIAAAMADQWGPLL